MGYEAPRKTLRLVFEDHDGLEIKVRSMSFGKLLSLGEELTALKDASDLSGVRDLVKEFSDSLISWNLTEDGEPLPTTVESLYGLESDFALDIIRSWANSAGGNVPVPLDQRSNDGTQSAVPSMNMETL